MRKKIVGEERDGRGLLGKSAAALSKGGETRLRLSAFVFTYVDKGRDPGGLPVLLHGLDMERGRREKGVVEGSMGIWNSGSKPWFGCCIVYVPLSGSR